MSEQDRLANHYNHNVTRENNQRLIDVITVDLY